VAQQDERALTRRLFLAGLAGVGCASAAACGSGAPAGSPVAPSTPATQPLTPVARPLREVAAAAGRLYGAAVEPSTLSSDGAFAAAVTSECGIITPENSLKWAALRPAPDQFDFSRGDALRSFASAGGMVLHGHTLVWHNSLPAWFASTVNAQNAERHLTEHIATVARHYAGSIHSWDVVNEAVEPTSGRADGLRATPWLTMLGPDYIDLAFVTAAAADPGALLCYNEYGLEFTWSGSRRDATLRLLSGLKSRGVPLHALGVQGHVGGTGWAQFDASGFGAFLRDVARLGVRIYITELDVKDNAMSADVTARDLQVAAVYRDYLAVALAEPAVAAVITWGLSDKYSWIRTSAPRSDGLAVRPLPLDADMKRKPAWDAIAAALGGPRTSGRATRPAGENGGVSGTADPAPLPGPAGARPHGTPPARPDRREPGTAKVPARRGGW
jgi:endo-1,4-beta-xylanase